MNRTEETACKETKRETMMLTRKADITGTGAYQDVSFEHEIAWVRKSEGKARMLHGGVELQDLVTCNDFYGYLTSLTREDAAIGYAEDTCETYSVTTESSLEVEVIATIFDVPLIPTDEKPAFGGRRVYRETPGDWRIKATGAPLEIVTVVEEKIWSSKLGKTENEENLQRFLKKVALAEPVPA